MKNKELIEGFVVGFIIVFIFGCVFIAGINNSVYETKYIQVVCPEQYPGILEKIIVADMVKEINVLNGGKILLNLELEVEEKNKKLYYNKHVISINERTDISINDILLKDLFVINIDENLEPKNNKYINVRLLLQDIDYWKVQNIKINDVVKNKYDDFVLAEIMNISISEALIQGITENGVYFSLPNPDKYNLYLELKINNIYFDNKKIGDIMDIEFDNYKISGFIIGIDRGNDDGK